MRLQKTVTEIARTRKKKERMAESERERKREFKLNQNMYISCGATRPFEHSMITLHTYMQ